MASTIKCDTFYKTLVMSTNFTLKAVHQNLKFGTCDLVKSDPSFFDLLTVTTN